MPTEADIKTSVIQVTNRPDLDLETTQALSRALMATHLASHFYFDVVEIVSGVGFTLTAALQQSIALPTRFRDVKYARTTRVSSIYVNNTLNGVLTYLPSSALFGDNYLSQSDVYWKAGTNLHFRFKDSVPATLNLGYYRLPTFADSWVAANFAEPIIYKAISEIFKLMHNREQAQQYDQNWQQAMGHLQQIGFDV